MTVRADANAEIGLGHLRRCAVLLEHFRGLGHNTRVLLRGPLDRGIVPMLRGLPVQSLDETAFLPASLATEAGDALGVLAIIGRKPNRQSWVVVDHYGLSETWEATIRAEGHFVMAFDDFRHRQHCAEILVSDAELPFNPALNSCRGAVSLAGPPFALVGADFAYAADIPAESGRRRLLITYGGSDPTDETTKALDAVRLLAPNPACDAHLDVTVVIGPANPRKDVLQRKAAAIKGISVVVAPPSLAPLMREADLVLTAGGNSVVEALAMRKPCVVTVVTDNQELMADQLIRRGVICLAGMHRSVSARGLADTVASAMRDYAGFAERVRYHPVFDHLGASRIAQAMATLQA